KGKESSKTGMVARRVAVLSAIANCSESEIGFLVNLLLEPFSVVLKQIDIIDSEFRLVPNLDINKFVSCRKQLGYLNFLGDFLKQLGSFLLPFVPDMFKVVLYIIHSSQKNLTEEIGQEDALDAINNDVEMEVYDHGRQLKSIRQLGLKRIVDFFKIPFSFNYQPYIKEMFRSFISIRIPKFNTENTQAPSALMELFAVWASKRDYLLYLVDYNKELLPKLFACISSKKVQESVVTKVLDIVENILHICENEMEVDTEDVQMEEKGLIETVLKPHVSTLLDNLENVLTQSSKSASFGKDAFSRREISILSQIAVYVDNEEQAKKLVDLLLPCLRINSRIISEKTKANILQIVAKFLRIIPELLPSSKLFLKYFNYISREFSTLRSRDCRKSLVQVLEEFSKLDNSLKEVVELVDDLNSFSTKLLGELDFERRLNAFNRINQESYRKFTPLQWLPLLHNCLFFIQDHEELSIRNNSSFCITRFVDRVIEFEVECEGHDDQGKFRDLLIHVVYPAIKKGMRLSLELVRVEFLTILSYVVKKCPKIDQFSDMTCLLFHDDESNFFNNIHHIQLHRRIRALKRFSNECAEGKLKKSSLVQIVLPLIGHFITDADRVDHTLINETVSTIGIIAAQLNWGQYYSLLKQYMRLIPRKVALEKVLVKTIITILDNFHFDVLNVENCSIEQSALTEKLDAIHPHNDQSQENLDNDQQKDDFENADEDVGADDDNLVNGEDHLNKDMLIDETSTRSQAQRIHDTVVRHLLPELKQYLTQNNKENVSVRVPVALAITKLLKALPEESLRFNLPGMLTTICQVLRSRSQEIRETTRDTLIKISNLLGPLYFSFIVKELQGALTQGYQLHILGYTLNSLLTNLVPTLQVGEIDYCLRMIIDIMINDIFGEVGEEKETEEITGKMKEMKVNKSIGSFQLLAKIIKFKNIGLLLMPLKEIMRETQSAKVLQKVDEILQKISIGLDENPHFQAREMITFCNGLITQNLDISKPTPKNKVNKTNMEMNYTVQLKRNTADHTDYFETNSYLFVQFGLTIFLTALKHEKFDLKSEEGLNMLSPFVDIIGNSMYSQHLAINVLAIKIMCIICRLNLKPLDNALPVIVKQTFSLIKTSNSTNSVLVQNCFKLLAIIIRDCKQVDLKESQLTFLIDLIRPDLEEPSRQNTTFSLIRAIVSRKFVVPELYDLMQSISEIMVTNQSSGTRDLARQILLQFILNYPQGRGRLKNQMNFLVKNLNYVFESGRQSVMEMINLLINKFGDDLLMEYAEMLFLALVMSLVNDETNKCREMAGALIKILLRRMDDQRLRNVYLLLDKWFNKSEKKSMQRMAVQVYGLVIETFGERFKKHITELLDVLRNALISSKQVLEQLETITSDNEDKHDNIVDNADWELGYYSLNTFTKLVKKFPSIIYSEMEKIKEIWLLVEEHILYPHAWVRLAASRLFGMYFAIINPETMIASGSNTKIEYLSRDILRKLSSSFCTQLKSELLGPELAMQIVKNLFFIGKCFYYMLPDKDIGDVKTMDEIGDTSKDFQDDKEDGKEDDKESPDSMVEDNNINDVPDADEQQFTRDLKVESSNNSRKSLHWLFKKLSYQARFASIKKDDVDHQRKSIYQWIAAMITFMPPEESEQYISLSISPIYRFVNDETIKGQEIDNLKLLGREVLDIIQKR
ncbi:8263_t:CDS:2, partial [Acaulospora morrowiae]